MSITFPFEEALSPSVGKIKRPIAKVELYNKKLNFWVPYTMIVDTGADYTIVPIHLVDFLNINLETETKLTITRGIGGLVNIFLLKGRIKAKVGYFERNIKLGIINSIKTPALLGRYGFLETFKVVLENFTTTFS